MKSMRDMMNLMENGFDDDDDDDVSPHEYKDIGMHMPTLVLDEEGMAGAIEDFVGTEVAKEWEAYLHSTLSEFTDPDDSRHYAMMANEWLTANNVPITVLNMTTDDDGFSYLFDVTPDDRERVHETITEGKNMKNMREMMNLMEGVMAVPGLNEAGPKKYEVPAYQRKEKGEKPLTPKDIEDEDKKGKLSNLDNLKQAAKDIKPGMGNISEDVFDKNFDEPSDDYTDWTMNQGEMGNPSRGLDPIGGVDNVTKGLEMYKSYIDSFVEPQEALDHVMINFADQGVDAGEIDEIVDAIRIRYGDSSQEDDYTDWSMRQGEMGLEEAVGGLPGFGDIGDDPADARYDKALKAIAALFGPEIWDSDIMGQYVSELEANNPTDEELDQIINTSQLPPRLANIEFSTDDDPFLESHVDSCRQTNPAIARKACKMEEEDIPEVDDEEELEEDLQNGYNDRHCASGNDYFPNGADGPVVRKVGPSGARHGDNPEQKSMKVEIDEVHKELVYGYRSFLSEAAKKKHKLPEPRKPLKTDNPYENKWAHLGAGQGTPVSPDDHELWNKENKRIAKLKAADKKKADAKKKAKKK